MSTLPNTTAQDIPYWVALASFPKFGARRFGLLQNAFTTMEQAFHASVSALCTAGIPTALAHEFATYRDNHDPHALMATLAREDIKVVTSGDPIYPRLLTHTHDAPPVLWYRGDMTRNATLCLAVVGSRKYSTYGQRVVERIVGDCSEAGLSIVSGLALGIDALAHQAALARGGRTVAVLGSGVNHAAVYPATNRMLAERIVASGGLVVSEFPYGTAALRHHFPQRNRIIAGLCEGTLVIEAHAASGALITARYALDANREVFAVPNDIFRPNAIGTNTLIKQGARVVSCAQDILDGLGIANVAATVTARTTLPHTPFERRLSDAFHDTEQLHINQLARVLQLDTPTVSATLLTMELKGLVKHIGGGNYVLS